jgi:hypothetical protein
MPILRNLKKLRSICLGWYRFLFAKRSDMAKVRMSFCLSCRERRAFFCGVCWCELHAKTEVEEEECPKKYW